MKNGARNFLALLGKLRELPARQRKLFNAIAPLTIARKYTMAVIFVAGATALHWLLERVVGVGYAYILHYPAVMLAALIGGLLPGMLATALSGIAVAWFFLTPRGSFSVTYFRMLSLWEYSASMASSSASSHTAFEKPPWRPGRKARRSFASVSSWRRSGLSNGISKQAQNDGAPCWRRCTDFHLEVSRASMMRG